MIGVEMVSLSDKEQYERLGQDWRQVHNILWGIPSIAISIITGIVVAAYQPYMEGWPRILVLTVGSIFLFSITVEVIKKRVLMNAISARLAKLEKSNGIEPFPTSTPGLIKEANDPKIRDPLYKIFKMSIARKYLAYVVFVAAILVAILTCWELAKFLI